MSSCLSPGSGLSLHSKRSKRSALTATARHLTKRLALMDASVIVGFAASWASALLAAAVDATEQPNMLPTMKDVAFWNAEAAKAPPHGDSSAMEKRAARIVDAAVEWALAPVFYCCVLVDSLQLQLRWPSPEILSSAVVSLMLSVFVVIAAAATQLQAFAAGFRYKARNSRAVRVTPSAAEHEGGAGIRT